MNNKTEFGSYSLKTPLICGFVALACLVSILGGWGIYARLAGAVVASGVVEVESRSQIVQHPDGGVVTKIHVRDGNQVQRGDVLIELDHTFLRSELKKIEGQLHEIEARKWRLVAERDRTKFYQTKNTDNSAVQALHKGQERMHAARLKARTLFNDLIEEQVEQLKIKRKALTDEFNTVSIQHKMISEEYEVIKKLREKELTTISQLRSVMRAMTQASGQMRQITFNLQQLVSEQKRLHLSQREHEAKLQEQIITELRDLEFEERTLNESHNSLSERINRLHIRAPADGEVFGLTVFTVNAVIKPGEPVMHIVPNDQPHVIMAQVRSMDRDAIFPGQKTSLMFTGLDKTFQAEIEGRVTKISANAFRDENTGGLNYQVEIEPDSSAMLKLEGQKILPGMPVEAYIQTSSHSPLTYLTKPLLIYLERAMRE